MPTWSSRGAPSGTIDISRSISQMLRRSPAIPPIAESSTLSVSICRMMRPRLAPIAARIAISFCLAALRARSRLATFAQAISSTNPTAPSSARSDGFTSRTSRSWRIARFASQPLFVSKNCLVSCALMALIRVWACCRSMPGFRRAIADHERLSRGSSERLDRARHPNLSLLREFKSGRHHADDGDGS